MRRGRVDAQKFESCQLILTVPLFNVERRPRPAPHLRPTMSKPVAPESGENRTNCFVQPAPPCQCANRKCSTFPLHALNLGFMQQKWPYVRVCSPSRSDVPHVRVFQQQVVHRGDIVANCSFFRFHAAKIALSTSFEGILQRYGVLVRAIPAAGRT